MDSTENALTDHQVTLHAIAHAAHPCTDTRSLFASCSACCARMGLTGSVLHCCRGCNASCVSSTRTQGMRRPSNITGWTPRACSTPPSSRLIQSSPWRQCSMRSVSTSRHHGRSGKPEATPVLSNAHGKEARLLQRKPSGLRRCSYRGDWSSCQC
jgi:hypothetical protein